MQVETKGLLERMDAGWRDAFERMDQRAENRYRNLREQLDGNV